MIVISGTIDRSWNSRIEKARSPCGVFSSLSDRSIGSTCAVDDRASGRPIASDASAEKPEAEIENSRDRQPAQQRPAPAQVRRCPCASRHKPARLKLQPDDEQQQRDADFGHALDRFRFVEQAEHRRTDQRAGNDIAQRRAQPEPAEQRDEDAARRQA